MKPKVSIIIPTYNRAWVIGLAVGSILQQSFKDYEIIVVDDGSTDDTKQVLSCLPIRYIYQDHAGAPAARNRGILEANGEYIAFLDSDDAFLRGKLEKQLGIMLANPQAVLSHTSYIRRVEGKKDKVINSGTFSGDVYPRLLFHCPIAMSTVMVKASCLNGYGFRENIDCADDLILWAKLARLQPIIGIGEPLTCIYVGSVTNAFNPSRQLASIPYIVGYGVKQDANLSPIMKVILLLFWKGLKLPFWKIMGFIKKQ